MREKAAQGIYPSRPPLGYTNNKLNHTIEAMAIQGLQEAGPDQLLTAKKTLELANKAYFLYVTQNPTEQAKLLKMVLSNRKTEGVSLYPTYKKPFDLIFERAKTKEWRARRDSNSRPIAPEAIALSS